jgi:hypothetical protein
MFKRALKIYLTNKKLFKMGLPNKYLKEEDIKVPKYAPCIAEYAENALSNVDWETFMVKNQDKAYIAKESNDCEEDSSVDSEEDRLLKVEKWRVSNKKVQFKCTWETGDTEKSIWDNFELLQIDYPQLVAEYLNNNIDCYVKCQLYEVILDETQNYITLTEEDINVKKTGEITKKLKIVDVILLDCENEHKDLWDFNDIDKNAWYKEGTALFGTLCKDCGVEISKETITVSKPVKLCKNYGTKGCCVTFCNKCWMDILQNTNNTNKRRGK